MGLVLVLGLGLGLGLGGGSGGVGGCCFGFPHKVADGSDGLFARLGLFVRVLGFADEVDEEAKVDLVVFMSRGMSVVSRASDVAKGERGVGAGQMTVGGVHGTWGTWETWGCLILFFDGKSGRGEGARSVVLDQIKKGGRRLTVNK